MQSHSGVRALEVLSVQEDALGPYAKIKATMVDGEIVIRWGLDPFTFAHLSKLIITQSTSWSNETGYKCLLALDEMQNPTGQGTVCSLLIQLGVDMVRLSFTCSELFQSNLAWLRGLHSVDDLRDLDWNHWISSYYAHISPTTGTTPSEAVGFGAKLRWRPFWVALAVIVIGLSAFVWYTVSHAFATIAPNDTKSPSSTAGVTDASGDLATHPHTSKHRTHDGTTHTRTVAKLLQPPANESTSGTRPDSAQVYEVGPGDVALTIDDGPSLYVPQMLHTLAANHVHATFFFIAKNVAQWPDIAREVAAQGNVIGDHTVDHRDLRTLDATQQQWEIMHGLREIQHYVHVPVVLFRPPFESFDATTEELLDKDHLTMALYNRDPRDWAATTPNEIVRSVLRLPASGGVFDLHSDRNTALALPAIIRALKARHLHFVVLSAPKALLATP